MSSIAGLKLPVPVHIVTGGLGAGKTSFIQALLKQKPEDERWGLIINEFGAVGIDQAVLESTLPGGEVRVRELAGGCMCCSLSGVTSVAIAQLLRAIKPDRLWIEPSGLGHPAALVDVLRGEHLASALELQPIVCLVDLVQFRPARLPWGAQPDFWANELYRDQVSIADILVGSKADLGGSQAVAAFRQWAGRLYPPKEKVLTASHGALNMPPSSMPAATSATPAAATAGIAALSISARPKQENPMQQPQAGSTAASGTYSMASSSIAQSQQGVLPPPSRPRAAQREGPGSLLWLSSAEQAEGPQPGRPQLKESRDERMRAVACGWIFHPGDTFNRPALEHFLSLALQQAPAVKRVKGVFRVSPKTWMSASAGGSSSPVVAPAGQQGDTGAGGEGEGQAVQLQEVAYRRDSRLEVIMAMAEEGDHAGHAGQGAAAAGGEASLAASVGPGGGALPGGQGPLAISESGTDAKEQQQEQQQQGAQRGSSTASTEGQLSAEALVAAIIRAQQGDYSSLDAIVLTLLQA